jgi:uncharacterized protein YeaO (DUF488 family)
MVRLKRASERASDDDGDRILVDRLWPRGLSKERAHIDDWMRDVAPSDALRRWFGHDPARWAEFRERYRRELDTVAGRELVADLVRRARRGTITLVYSAHDEEHNDAVVLRGVVERKLARGGPSRGSRHRGTAMAASPARRP